MIEREAAAFELLSKVLSNDYFYKKLRVQGGAYGGGSIYSPLEGTLPLFSYRDPHLVETYDVYAGMVDYLREGGLTDEAVDGSRVGAIGAFDRIYSPLQQLSAARTRHLHGVSDADRERFRNGLFDATAEEIASLAVPILADALPEGPRAAVSTREKLEEANQKLDSALEIVSLD
jgi:Zn-dependent M16 (insulinase) family peptidase